MVLAGPADLCDGHAASCAGHAADGAPLVQGYAVSINLKADINGVAHAGRAYPRAIGFERALADPARMYWQLSHER